MTHTPPHLDDLSVDELSQIASAIVGLKEAGFLMQEQGFDARFSLVPGMSVTMKLSYKMPMPGPMAVLYPPPPEVETYDLVDCTSAPDPLPSFLRPWSDSGETESDQPRQGPTAAEVDAAVNEACNKVLPRAAAMAAEPPIEKIEIRPVAPPTPAAPIASRPAVWTEEEDARLVDLVAQLIARGMKKGAAIMAAAAELGRPFEGVKFRLGTKLANRLSAALGADRGADHEARDDAGHDPQKAAPPASGLAPIEAHLHSLPRKGGWTMERDHELLDLACLGWQMPEIAAEMGQDAGAVRDRFDLLTGLDRDTKNRAWTRSALREALEPWVAKPGSAAAAE